MHWRDRRPARRRLIKRWATMGRCHHHRIIAKMPQRRFRAALYYRRVTSKRIARNADKSAPGRLAIITVTAYGRASARYAMNRIIMATASRAAIFFARAALRHVISAFTPPARPTPMSPCFRRAIRFQ